MSDIPYQKQRIQYSDGSWSMFYTVHIPADKLKFEDLHPKSSYVRQQDIARMHYARARARGDANPHILTWPAMQTDRRASQLFAGLSHAADDGEQIISANSFITYVLRRLLAEGWLQLHEYISDTYEWHTQAPPEHTAWQARADAFTRWLEETIQLDLYPNIEKGSYQPRIFHSFNANQNFVRIGRCDFIRHFIQSIQRQAVFNTSHFLHEHDDLISYHSGYGDPVGLMVAENTILRPPIYKRGCLLYDGQRWVIRTLSLADIAIVIPGDLKLSRDDRGGCRFCLNPEQAQPIAVYTRAGHRGAKGQPLNRTPLAAGRIEYVIVNRQVVSWKQGGGLRIPQNGFVLSLQADALPVAAMDSIIHDAWVEYELADPAQRIQSGIQAGPILLSGGQSMIHQALEHEEFQASQTINGKPVIGISPVHMNLASDTVRKARTALGIKADGDLVLAVVDGCDSAWRTDLDSAGATLREVIDFLIEQGAVDALNLSGEGSSHLFIQGGLCSIPAERRGQRGIVYERMLPSIGIVD